MTRNGFSTTAVGLTASIVSLVVFASPVARAHPMSGDHAMFVQGINGAAIAPFMPRASTSSRRNEGHGVYTAPFPGIHGWYWENREQKEVTVRLSTAGFYSGAQEFFKRRQRAPRGRRTCRAERWVKPDKRAGLWLVFSRAGRAG